MVYILSYRSTWCACGLEGLPSSDLGPIGIVGSEYVHMEMNSMNSFGAHLGRDCTVDIEGFGPKHEMVTRTTSSGYSAKGSIRPRPSVMKREGTLVGDHPRCDKGVDSHSPR